tara:strand:- start:5082 stop:5561 length:480 start_codon:yes stop_codon:yes gene_type:complete
MTTIADYVGRTVDVLAFDGVKGEGQGEALLAQELFDDKYSGLVCTGIQKLAQRFILELLTDKGSMTGKPDNGTGLMRAYRQGVVRSEIDAAQEWAFAVNEALANMKKEELETDPEDERIESVELQSVAFAAGVKAAYHAKLISVAGTSRQVILPLPIVP